MDWQFKVGLGLAIIFGLLPFVVKFMPDWVTWPGITIGILFIIWGLLPNHQKIPIGPALLIITGFAVIAVGAAWYRASQPVMPERRFSVSLVNSFMGGPYFAYVSDNKLYFIDVLLCIDIVNKSKEFTMINNYYVQVLIDNKWITLQRILINQSLGKKGQFLLVQEIKTAREMASTIEFNRKTIDEQIINTNIDPGKTISGLMIFYFDDIYRHTYNQSIPTDMKIVIVDSLHNREEHYIIPSEQKKLTIGNGDKVAGWFGALGFKIIKTGIDLKSFKIMNDLK